MPKLYKRPRSPYWWAEGYDSEGQRWRESTKSRDRSVASKVAKRLEREKLLADPGLPELTLWDALELLRAHKERREVSDATMEILATKGGQLLRVLGPRRNVAALTLLDAEAYLDQRVREGVSKHTISKEWGTLRGALRQARRHGMYPADPADIWPDALRDVYTPKDRWLTLEEYRRLMLALPRGRADHLTMYCHTGVRYGELCRLTVQDVNRDAQTVFVRGKKGRKDRAERVIPLSADAWQVVEPRLRSGSGPLFPDEWGRSVMARTLKASSVRAGIPRVDSANDLRRTFCSWLANSGVPEHVTVRMMGHTSSAMVRRVYAQLAPSTLRDAIDRLPCANSVRIPPPKPAIVATDAKAPSE